MHVWVINRAGFIKRAIWAKMRFHCHPPPPTVPAPGRPGDGAAVQDRLWKRSLALELENLLGGIVSVKLAEASSPIGLFFASLGYSEGCRGWFLTRGSCLQPLQFLDSQQLPSVGQT